MQLQAGTSETLRPWWASIKIIILVTLLCYLLLCFLCRSIESSPNYFDNCNNLVVNTTSLQAFSAQQKKSELWKETRFIDDAKKSIMQICVEHPKSHSYRFWLWQDYPSGGSPNLPIKPRSIRSFVEYKARLVLTHPEGYLEVLVCSGMDQHF